MRDPTERVRDILEAIGQIKRYSQRGQEIFERDELIQSWCVRHIQIIGEAARALPKAVCAQAPDVPWREIIGMRHILVHDYFGIDTDAVWEVIAKELPLFETQIQALLTLLEDTP